MEKKPTPFNINWVTHEHEYKERSQDWLWAVGIVAVSIAIASVIFGNTIFGILVLVASFSMAIFINREPDEVEIVVNEKGIARGRIFYPYESIDSFWIDHEHSHPKILLRSKKFFLPLIIVPLGDSDPEEIHSTLSRLLDEEFHSLPFIERLLEYLGF